MIVKRFRISGFRHSFDIDAHFEQGINYIIGHNGTGKTTFVRMLVAAIRCNTAELGRSLFSRIELELGTKERPAENRLYIYQKTPEIQAEFGPRAFEAILRTEAGLEHRTHSQALRFAGRSPGSVPQRYKALDRDRLVALPDDMQRRIGEATAIEGAVAIRKSLESVQWSWLPIERALRKTSASNEDEEAADSSNPVDRKLDEVQRKLVLYSYDLDKRKAAAFEQFRNLALLALFNVENTNRKSAISKIAVEEVEGELDKLIPKLGLHEDLERQFRDKAQNLVVALKSRKGGRPVEALRQALARLQEVLVVWAETEGAVQSLYARRDSFLHSLEDAFSLNDLLPEQRRKFAKVPRMSEDNDLVFVQDPDGRKLLLSLDALSSGEKQFIIMLAESLLERDQDTIFLIDEPEISLHISWQSRLVRDIRRLNPNAQLILATHSPDVVQDQRQNIIRMESAVISA